MIKCYCSIATQGLKVANRKFDLKELRAIRCCRYEIRNWMPFLHGRFGWHLVKQQCRNVFWLWRIQCFINQWYCKINFFWQRTSLTSSNFLCLWRLKQQKVRRMDSFPIFLWMNNKYFVLQGHGLFIFCLSNPIMVFKCLFFFFSRSPQQKGTWPR